MIIHTLQMHISNSAAAEFVDEFPSSLYSVLIVGPASSSAKIDYAGTFFGGFTIYQKLKVLAIHFNKGSIEVLIEFDIDAVDGHDIFA